MINRTIDIIPVQQTESRDTVLAAAQFSEHYCEHCGCAVPPNQVRWLQKLSDGHWTRETDKVIAVNFCTDAHCVGYSAVCPRCERELAKLMATEGEEVFASFAPPVRATLVIRVSGTDEKGRQTYTDFRGYEYYNAGTSEAPDIYTRSLIGDKGVRVTDAFDIQVVPESYIFKTNNQFKRY